MTESVYLLLRADKVRRSKKNAAGGYPAASSTETYCKTIRRRGGGKAPPHAGLEVQLQPDLHNAWVKG
jgi:hypothetical protein